MDTIILLAIGARLDKLEARAAWAEGYVEVVEDALIASLPPCTLGLAGPLFSAAHWADCRRCAALVALEEFKVTRRPGEASAREDGT